MRRLEPGREPVLPQEREVVPPVPQALEAEPPVLRPEESGSVYFQVLKEEFFPIFSRPEVPREPDCSRWAPAEPKALPEEALKARPHGPTARIPYNVRAATAKAPD